MSSSVLIVDDSEENRDMLARILGRQDYEISVAESGQKAFEVLRTVKPDVILLDIKMPDVSGYEVCRALKDDPETSAIPVIFISAYSEAVNKVTAFEAGAVDYVTKPFDFREVAARVKTHVDLHRLRTSLEEKNHALEQLGRHRDHLVSMIVHDMRTPLSIITTSMELVAEELQGTVSDLIMEDLKTARSHAAKLAEMTEEVLHVRKLESEGLELSLVQCNMEDLVTDIVDGFRLLVDRHDIQFTAQREISVYCDVEYTRRVLVNLISNAVRAMSDPGTLSVDVTRQKRFCKISITDTGSGITPEELPYIFESYVRASSSSSYETQKSVGLGLTLCKLAVGAHGGRIDVRSRVGEGTTFDVYLPLEGPS